jgi:hypothetical protein
MGRQRDLAERREQAEAEAREHFYARLRDVRTFSAAQSLVDHGPREGQPGRHVHSNLGFFLLEFQIPYGAQLEELALYVAMIERFHTDPVVINKEALRQTTDRIMSAMDKKRRP